MSSPLTSHGSLSLAMCSMSYSAKFVPFRSHKRLVESQDCQCVNGPARHTGIFTDPHTCAGVQLDTAIYRDSWEVSRCPIEVVLLEYVCAASSELDTVIYRNKSILGLVFSIPAKRTSHIQAPNKPFCTLLALLAEENLE